MQVVADDALRAGPWMLLAPVPSPAAPGTHEDEFGIEKRMRRLTAAGPWEELRESYAFGKGKDKRELRWIECTEEFNVPPVGAPGALDTQVFDFNALFRLGAPQNERVAAYLYRSIESAEARELPLTCGSDDGLRLWLNGEMLLDRAAARGLNPKEERFTLRLRPGRNHLLVKVVNVGGGWSFQMMTPLRVDQARINAAIDRGVEWLLNQQLIDGSWAEVQGEYRNGTTALALYTLLKSGVSANHPAVHQALAYLQNYPADKTYAAGCQLMAAAAMKDPQHLWWAEETAGDLLTWQERDGGWGYPSGHTDLSLTQYAALGLRAAASLGIEVPVEVWQRMAEFALAHQASWKSTERQPAAGFRYRPDSGVTGSMSSAGIAVLYICREQLGEKMKPLIKRGVDDAIEAGERWIAANFTVRENPGQAEWHYYYLYGLERIGALLQQERFGEREWYWEGADWLVNAQGGAGEWGDAWGHWERSTCFALLFLNRATSRPVTQPEPGDPARSKLVSSAAQDRVRLKIVRQTPAVFWVDEAPAPAGQPVGPRILRVEYWIRPVGGEWMLALESAERRFAGRWNLSRPGEWEAYAEAVLEDGQRLRSSVVRFMHEEGVDAERLAYASDARRNRLPLQQPVVTASSQQGGFVPAGVADNRFDTRWVCEPGDRDPWIEVKLRRPIKTQELRLTHSRTSRKESELQNYNPRPTKVEVIFNKDEEPIVLDVDPDPYRKTVLRFSEPRKIGQVRIRILETTGGVLGENCAAGFTELELHEPSNN